MPDLQPNFKRGDRVTHDLVNDLIRGQAAPDVRCGPGMVVRQGAGGQLQLGLARRQFFVGKADGDIGARVSATWGQGKVAVHDFDGTNESSAGVSYDVANPSSSKMSTGAGISSGLQCLVMEDEAGYLIVIPLECN